MKKRTKIASLFLAMLMAFSLMAGTASAYDAGHEHDCAVCSEEGIGPKAGWGPFDYTQTCVRCGGFLALSPRNKYECPKCNP